MHFIILTLLALFAFNQNAQALDLLNTLKKTVEENVNLPTSTTSLAGGLSQSQIIEGLQEALKVGTQNVVSQIGAADGYNADPQIHIPLPDELKQVQNLLKKFGLSAMADDVELKLNRAAEQAAPQAKEIIWNAISNMNMEDAQAIYKGPKDAATQYFKKVASSDLQNIISPIAENSLKDVGALSAYDSLIGQYKSMPFVPDVKANLVNHTTELAMEGIFHYLAQEEAAIRENPAKRTTEILKTVFGK
ncbi:conserved exported hypothetical protein [Candidatus Terasakiella magnetica]|uniref:DUF4197 domain-containing protein n=2 Tax=Candidatus Terasakiella magnetica TaxID=1867952 RepID=A0A1C3RGG7_9PROT|nr:conserved exported hypothetical protein [Candidatus Terasakiella magnetica]